MSTYTPWDRAPNELRGSLLRHYLLHELDRVAPRTATVGELVAAAHRDGFILAGRPSKAVSDALRWELGNGRARRVARGRYVIGTLPRTTRWRIRKRIAAERRRAQGLPIA